MREFLCFHGDEYVDYGLLVHDSVYPCMLALKMEVINSSETLVTTCKTTQSHNPNDHNPKTSDVSGMSWLQ